MLSLLKINSIFLPRTIAHTTVWRINCRRKFIGIEAAGWPPPPLLAKLLFSEAFFLEIVPRLKKNKWGIILNWIWNSIIHKVVNFLLCLGETSHSLFHPLNYKSTVDIYITVSIFTSVYPLNLTVFRPVPLLIPVVVSQSVTNKSYLVCV